MSWPYAFFHALARGLAAASITLLVNGKVESFGLKLEGTEAGLLSLGMFVLAVVAARIESWTEKAEPA